LGRGANKEGVVTVRSSYEYLVSQVHSFENASHQKPILISNLLSDPILTSESIKWHSQKKIRRVSVIVGVNEYTNPNLSSLKFAVSDAEKLLKILNEMGGFDSEDCILLTNQEATYDNVKRALSDSLSKLQDGDLFFFYFSGHGFSSTDEGYAMLYDSKIDKNETFNLLKITELSKLANDSKVGTSIFVIDACMSPANNVAYALVGATETLSTSSNLQLEKSGDS
jgi:Caspase domain